MNKNKFIYFLMGLIPCNLLAWSVPFEDTLVKNPEVQSTSLWWYFVFCLSTILGFIFCVKASKDFSNDNYTSGFISSAVVIITGLTSLLAQIFI